MNTPLKAGDRVHNAVYGVGTVEGFDRNEHGSQLVTVRWDKNPSHDLSHIENAIALQVFNCFVSSMVPKEWGKYGRARCSFWPIRLRRRFGGKARSAIASYMESFSSTLIRISLVDRPMMTPTPMA